jgi:DNA-binding CsgD family transcriptional regulator
MANSTEAHPQTLPFWGLLCSECIRSVNRNARTDLPKLTDRQRQCLQGFIARKTAKQIGRELGITHHAVEQHLKAARKKLGASDTLEAARIYAAAHTTVGPYYAAPEVSDTPPDEPFRDQSRRGMFQLRDSATDGPAMLQALSARQTLLAIGLCGFGAIAILSLIVAVANGVAQLAP